jgi:hypothetical protein
MTRHFDSRSTPELSHHSMKGTQMDDEQQRMWAMEQALRYCWQPQEDDDLRDFALDDIKDFADELLAYVRKDRHAQPVELHPDAKALLADCVAEFNAWQANQAKGLDDA